MGILNIAFFIVLGDLIGGISQSTNIDSTRAIINDMALRTTYISIGAFFSSFLGKVLLGIATHSIALKTKRLYFASVIKQEIGYFDCTSSGKIIKSLSEDVARLSGVIEFDVMNIMIAVGQIVSGFILSMVTSYKIGLLGFTSIPIMVLLVITSSLFISFLSRGSTLQSTKSVSTVNEVVTSIRTVKSMAGEKKEVMRYNQEIRSTSTFDFVSALLYSTCCSLIVFFIWGSTSLAMHYAGVMLQVGSMSINDIIWIWGFVSITVQGLQNLLYYIPEVLRIQNIIPPIINVVYRKPLISHSGGVNPDSLTGHIQFKNVKFTYPSRPNVVVLNNFCIDMMPGQSTALVGQSGSGKSTVIGLLQKWYQSDAGRITIDGIDLETIDPACIHKHIGIVSQEPTLFARTISENITYVVDNINHNTRQELTRQGASEETIQNKMIVVSQQMIEDAARTANAHDFITLLPLGYETVLSQNVSLSGGQKQRIAIARAILQNPNILLLDEATSALDTKSESLVQDALEKLMVGRTTIIIAHRLSTIQKCDKIIVMKSGVVIEQGSHDDLVNKEDGHYRGLVAKQAAFTKRDDVTMTSERTDLFTYSEVDELSEVEISSEPGSACGTPEMRSYLMKDCKMSEPNVNSDPGTPDPANYLIHKTFKKKFDAQKNQLDHNKVEPVGEDQQDVKDPKVHSFLEIFKYFGCDVLFFPLMLLGSICTGAIPILTMFIFGRITNKIVPSRNRDGNLVPFPPGYSYSTAITEEVMYLVYLAICGCIATFAYYFFSELLCSRISYRINKAMFKSIVRQEIGYFDILKSGRLLSIFGKDVHHVKVGLSRHLSNITRNASQFLIGVIIAMITSWQMTLVMVSVSLVTTFTTVFVMQKFISYFQKKYSTQIDNGMIIASEILSSIRTVRSMSGEDREIERYAVSCRLAMKYACGFTTCASILFGVGMFCIWAATALVVYYGGILLAQGELKAAAMTQVTSNMVVAIFSMSLAMMELDALFKAIASSKELLKIIKRKPQLSLGNKTIEGGMRGEIEFNNVCFSYPTRPGAKILKKFSLKIDKGQHVALVGESGCGKSTITGLLERFYDTNRGNIKIDGVNIREINLDWLHRNIAIVTQEPVLFATSIKNNITYALSGETSMEQIQQAAKAANAHDFIMSLPNNYDTVIGERGVSLSGGQKQRIAIARAIIQNAAILLLDEATSALDTESEYLVQSALDTLMNGRTTIIIAHRMSTIRNCDTIVVIKNGRVEEMGNHEGLMDREGEYCKLVHKQIEN
ncbi:ATP-binding cassette, subfamily B (MDR/TAP), member [Acrasis kona]|uniref:ATP-binding cassette, subfamily B (MDR/TAP), member n=1 Tax=Acrasis kona TaxID=1008807 RepID=A0AAW2YQY9_9EUKA